MTKQQMSNLFSWLPPSNQPQPQPQPNSGHSMLFRIDEGSFADEVYDTLTSEDVKFTCEQEDDLGYTIEAQTED